MAHQTPSSKTVSTCAPRREQGTHLFHILGYSQHRAAGASECIESDKFPVGGHDWRLIFYPDGVAGYGHQVVAALYLVGKNIKLGAGLIGAETARPERRAILNSAQGGVESV